MSKTPAAASKPSKSKKITQPGNNHLSREATSRDHLHKSEGRAAFTGQSVRMQWQQPERGLVMQPGRPGPGGILTARYTSPVIATRFPATEFLPAWNVRLTGPGQSMRIYMRLHSAEVSRPSPWLLVGEVGKPPADPSVRTQAPGWGSTRIDYIELQRPANAFQYRMEFFANNSDSLQKDHAPVLRRLFVHYSGPGKPARAGDAPVKNSGGSHIPVPYRSQLTVEKEDLRNIICCPTSLAMVLEHHGIDRPTLDVCSDAYSHRYKMYGVWPHVSHVAFQHGFTSWIQRFRSHSDVRRYLDSGHPIIASIRVKEGELRGAQYGKSNGHIIVITGYRRDGSYIVNDPASAGAGGAEIDYFADDMDKVWLDKGGVAILIKPEN